MSKETKPAGSPAAAASTEVVGTPGREAVASPQGTSLGDPLVPQGKQAPTVAQVGAEALASEAQAQNLQSQPLRPKHKDDVSREVDVVDVRNLHKQDEFHNYKPYPSTTDDGLNLPAASTRSGSGLYAGYNEVKKRLFADGTTKLDRLQMSPEQLAQKFKTELKVDVMDSATDPVLLNIFTDMNQYVKDMGANTPVTQTEASTNQQIFLRRITDCLNADPEVGVVGLLMIEEYFKHYTAFAGQNAYRAFNTVNPALQKLQAVVYAIDTFASKGAEALKVISTDKLKEAASSPEGQVVLLAYANKHS